MLKVNPFRRVVLETILPLLERQDSKKSWLIPGLFMIKNNKAAKHTTYKLSIYNG